MVSIAMDISRESEVPLSPETPTAAGPRPKIIGSGTDISLSLFIVFLKREPEHLWIMQPGALRALCGLG